MGRPRGPRPPADAIRPLLATGASWTEIAAALGVAEHTVRRAAREYGLERDPQARPAAPPPPARPQSAPAPPDISPAEVAERSERVRRLLEDPRLVFEEMAELAVDRRAPASQRFKAQKQLTDALLGKAKAGQAVVGGEVPAARPFNPAVLDEENLRRYVDALRIVVEIEERFGGEGDGSEA